MEGNAQHYQKHGRSREPEDEQRMLPCRFYVNGFCVQGNRCRFYHPASTNLPMTIHVPPFPNDFAPPPLLNISPMGFVPSSPPIYGFIPTTTQATPCYFGQEPEASLSSMDQDYTPRRSSYFQAEVGEEGDASTVILPNGVTSTFQNGMASYEYPQSTLRSQPEGNQTHGVEYDGGEEGDGHTMFTHINWNEFMLPGKSPPAYVAVPLESDDAEKTETEKATARDGENSERDMPPEGSSGAGKMSVKEEFHLKVKLVALDLQDGPISQVRSLDSFFINHEGLENLPPEMLARKENHWERANGERDLTEPKSHEMVPVPDLVDESGLAGTTDESNEESEEECENSSVVKDENSCQISV